MTRYLVIHGHQFDVRLDSKPEQKVVEILDRISTAADLSWFNRIRAALQDDQRGNADLIAGAKRLGYPTICGHSHVAGIAPGFWNCGTWRGPRQPHYVLFPREKIAVISDLHLGTTEAKEYEDALIAFLIHALKNEWRIISAGDGVDCWAHSLEEIWSTSYRPMEVLTAYPNLTIIRGNHDNDAAKLRLMYRMSGTQIPFYTFVDTNDTPELIEWEG